MPWAGTVPQVPSLKDVRAWAEATNATQAELQELAELVQRLAVQATSWRILHRLGLTERQREIGELEQLPRRNLDAGLPGGVFAQVKHGSNIQLLLYSLVATAIRVFQPTMVPGLLQIADYARRVMSQGNPSDQADMAAAVAKRIERQTILYDQNKQFEFLLTETALRWRPGPPGLMRAQLDHVVSMASLPNVSLGVLMLDQEAPDAYLHPFVLFEIDDDSLVTVETYSAELQVNDPQEVSGYRRTLDRHRSAARWREDAIDVIRAIASS